MYNWLRHVSRLKSKPNATKSFTGSECVMILGNVRTGDERDRNIEKNEPRRLDGKRIHGEGPAIVEKQGFRLFDEDIE
jgi:hypothetical protein